MNRIATRYELRRTNGDPAEPYGGSERGYELAAGRIQARCNAETVS
jgi:hypothetical protein